MTLYIWDQSHYDGPITTAIMARAKAEGIFGITHKVGEGTGGDDLHDGTALAAGRTVGMELLGGYHVVRSGPVAPQVDALLHLADRDEPWWRSFPGWVWQADLERWPYDNVSAATGIAFAKLLRERTGRQVFLYASHGQYGDQLRGWNGPLWNADYVARPAAGFVSMYPGDNWLPLHGGGWRGGWAPFSGQTPAILQYTSSATIAGLTTCDANAYRGTREQLLALIRPARAAPTTQGDDMNQWEHDRLSGAYDATVRIEAALTAVAKKVDIDPAELAAIQQAAAAGVTSVVPSIVDAIVAKLPADTLSREEVEQAVRDAFDGATIHPAAQ